LEQLTEPTIKSEHEFAGDRPIEQIEQGAVKAGAVGTVVGGVVAALTTLALPTLRQLQPTWVPSVVSIYLGWISVATIVNIASTLDSFGWQGAPLSSSLWTLLMIAISVGLALILLRVYADLAFSGVIIWAIGGITIANLNDPAITLGGLLAIAMLTIFTIQRTSSPV
jgi:hypothetical protein